MFCRFCGASIPADSAFCNVCGKLLTSVPERPLPDRAAPPTVPLSGSAQSAKTSAAPASRQRAARPEWSVRKRALVVLTPLVILGVLSALAGLVSAATHGNTNTPQCSSGNSPVFQDNGLYDQRTDSFTVCANWTVTWACDLRSTGGINYNIIIDIIDANTGANDGNVVNELCENGLEADTSQPIAQGGTYQLQIDSEGVWSVGVYD